MHFSCYEKTAEVPLSSSTVPTVLHAKIRRRDKAVGLAGYAFLSGRRCKGRPGLTASGTSFRQNENPARVCLPEVLPRGAGSREPSVECLEIISCYEGSARETRRRHRGSCGNRATEAAYFDSCNAEAHSRSGSRSPCFASSIISLATAIAAGSLRSTNPSLPNAASKAADILAMSSGPNEWSCSRNGRIGTVGS
jgi:hypothetical protein